MFESAKELLYRHSLSQNELEEYYRKKRIKEYHEDQYGVKRIPLHSLIHRILMPLLKIVKRMSGESLTIINDGRTKTKKPIIFCPTHIGGADVEMSLLAIHDPCWVVIGDPRELYRSFDGVLLQLNGAIMLDTQYKEDRKAAKAKMADLLKKGGNLLMYPEGTQDISPNALLNHLYAGAVDLAIICQAEIVPIALHRNKNKYFANIGANIRYEGKDYADRFKLTTELRDVMASLKWEIIEKLPSVSRQEIKASAYDDFVNEVLAMDASYTWTVDDIKASMFHPKGEANPEDVYAFMDKITPSSKNAFLFNKGRISNE